jgi:hypothetical protein
MELPKTKENIEHVIQELELNKEYLDDHAKKFVESVSDFYLYSKLVSKAQWEWLLFYYEELENEFNS